MFRKNGIDCRRFRSFILPGRPQKRPQYKVRVTYYFHFQLWNFFRPYQDTLKCSSTFPHTYPEQSFTCIQPENPKSENFRSIISISCVERFLKYTSPKGCRAPVGNSFRGFQATVSDTRTYSSLLSAGVPYIVYRIAATTFCSELAL